MLSEISLWKEGHGQGAHTMGDRKESGKHRRQGMPSMVYPRNLLFLVSLASWRPRVLTREPAETLSGHRTAQETRSRELAMNWAGLQGHIAGTLGHLSSQAEDQERSTGLLMTLYPSHIVQRSHYTSHMVRGICLSKPPEPL